MIEIITILLWIALGDIGYKLFTNTVEEIYGKLDEFYLPFPYLAFALLGFVSLALAVLYYLAYSDRPYKRLNKKETT